MTIQSTLFNVICIDILERYLHVLVMVWIIEKYTFSQQHTTCNHVQLWPDRKQQCLDFTHVKLDMKNKWGNFQLFFGTKMWNMSQQQIRQKCKKTEKKEKITICKRNTNIPMVIQWVYSTHHRYMVLLFLDQLSSAHWIARCTALL